MFQKKCPSPHRDSHFGNTSSFQEKFCKDDLGTPKSQEPIYRSKDHCRSNKQVRKLLQKKCVRLHTAIAVLATQALFIKSVPKTIWERQNPKSSLQHPDSHFGNTSSFQQKFRKDNLETPKSQNSAHRSKS